MPEAFDAHAAVTQPTPVQAPDRRRSPRYRLSTPIRARMQDQAMVPAITVEISESGLSALCGAELKVGDTLELEPIGGGRTSAVVRRSVGRLYGFEFLDLAPEQRQSIREKCKTLPLFKGGPLGV